MPRKKAKSIVPADPQKSSAAQFLTYVASTGAGGEKYEIRYEDENIWMSQKMLAEVYGVDLSTVGYHINKAFKDAELDKDSVIQKFWITAADGKNYSVNHYNLQVIIALGFKIDNERAVQFRKWVNQDGSGFGIHGAATRRNRVREVPCHTGPAFHERLRQISTRTGSAR